jgi:two-component system phosphate regulon sensor histidine kinase PhoR
VRWLTRSVPLRVGFAALAGLLAGVFVLALQLPPDVPLLAAGLIAGVATLAVASLAARSLTRPIERMITSIDGDRRFDAGGPRELERLGTSLRRMTEALADELRGAEKDRDRLAGLLDELGEAIIMAGADGRIERANRAAQAMFGPHLLGRAIVEVVRDHEFLEAIGAANTRSETIAQVERSDPPRFQRAVARRLDDGRLLLVVQELTAMRRLETVRRDFVANVTHELRTPLASLKAMVETLQSGALNDREAAADFVRRIRQEVDGLAGLVEDLLVLGRIESGREPLALAPTQPAELLGTAADRMRPLVERAGVRLVVEPAADLPLVTADRDRIGQVFANLLHNATRHTGPGGEIKMRAARAIDAILFEVRDTGDGIAADDLDRIFERFYKGDRSRATGGTGLGLSIVKHIVEAHGGSIQARSEGPGRGAVFSFTLPVARP